MSIIYKALRDLPDYEDHEAKTYQFNDSAQSSGLFNTKVKLFLVASIIVATALVVYNSVSAAATQQKQTIASVSKTNNTQLTGAIKQIAQVQNTQVKISADKTLEKAKINPAQLAEKPIVVPEELVQTAAHLAPVIEDKLVKVKSEAFVSAPAEVAEAAEKSDNTVHVEPMAEQNLVTDETVESESIKAISSPVQIASTIVKKSDDSAAGINTGKIRILRNKILRLLRGKQYAKAEASLDLLYAEVGDESPFYLKMKGFVQSKQGKIDAAYESYQRAIDFDNTDLDSQYNIALIAIKLKDYVSAKEYLNEVTKSPQYKDKAQRLLTNIAKLEKLEQMKREF